MRRQIIILIACSVYVVCLFVSGFLFELLAFLSLERRQQPDQHGARDHPHYRKVCFSLRNFFFKPQSFSVLILTTRSHHRETKRFGPNELDLSYITQRVIAANGSNDVGCVYSNIFHLFVDLFVCLFKYIFVCLLFFFVYFFLLLYFLFFSVVLNNLLPPTSAVNSTCACLWSRRIRRACYSSTFLTAST